MIYKFTTFIVCMCKEMVSRKKMKSCFLTTRSNNLILNRVSGCEEGEIMAVGAGGALGAIAPPFPQKKKGSKLNYPINTICLI